MTTILDIVDGEALAREDEYERAREAVWEALKSAGPNIRPAELEASITRERNDIGEVALMLAISDTLNS